MVHNHQYNVRNSSTATTPAETDESSIADDLMPATLASVPIIVVVLTLGLADQPALLHAILQDGNVAALVISLVPLFLPTIGASAVYLVKIRGWTAWTRRKTNLVALAIGLGFAIFVPLTYLLLQFGVLALTLTVMIGRRWRWRRPLLAAVLGVVVVVALGVIGAVSGWKWGERDYLPRVAVGRVLDGLMRMNIEDASGKRSVLIISNGDDAAIVATRDYAPRVESIPMDVIAKGRPCQLRPN